MSQTPLGDIAKGFATGLTGVLNAQTAADMEAKKFNMERKFTEDARRAEEAAGSPNNVIRITDPKTGTSKFLTRQSEALVEPAYAGYASVLPVEPSLHGHTNVIDATPGIIKQVKNPKPLSAKDADVVSAVDSAGTIFPQIKQSMTDLVTNNKGGFVHRAAMERLENNDNFMADTAYQGLSPSEQEFLDQQAMARSLVLRAFGATSSRDPRVKIYMDMLSVRKHGYDHVAENLDSLLDQMKTKINVLSDSGANVKKTSEPKQNSTSGTGYRSLFTDYLKK